MIPIVTPAEMGAIDAAAPEPVEVLIERAGSAVARLAREMLGGTYGRTVNVIVGKGNNGNDGRVAGERLQQRGVKVRYFVRADQTFRAMTPYVGVLFLGMIILIVFPWLTLVVPNAVFGR